MFHSIIVHELLHAVGLWHEHMRYDRDGFVKIHYENVASGTLMLQGGEHLEFEAAFIQAWRASSPL